jgi:hypothetical protein
MRTSISARRAGSGSISLFHFAPGVERCLLASASIRLASTAKPLPPTRPAAMHAAHDTFEHAPEDGAIAEGLVARTREHRMIRDLVLDREPTKPAIRKVHVSADVKPHRSTPLTAVRVHHPRWCRPTPSLARILHEKDSQLGAEAVSSLPALVLAHHLTRPRPKSRGLLPPAYRRAPRRFPPPWTVEDHNDACFIVKDRNGHAGEMATIYL